MFIEEDGIKDLQIGHKHAILLTETGSAKSWGDKTFGQTGNY